MGVTLIQNEITANNHEITAIALSEDMNQVRLGPSMQKSSVGQRAETTGPGPWNQRILMESLYPFCSLFFSLKDGKLGTVNLYVQHFFSSDSAAPI